MLKSVGSRAPPRSHESETPEAGPGNQDTRAQSRRNTGSFNPFSFPGGKLGLGMGSMSRRGPVSLGNWKALCGPLRGQWLLPLPSPVPMPPSPPPALTLTLEKPCTMEVVANGCAETFLETQALCSQTSCVLQCYLQNRKLCPIFATHILCLRVCGGAGQPGRVTSQAGTGGCSDSHSRKDSLPVTHKNKQTDPFAKIIRVGWPPQDYLFLEPRGIED